ncbi:MAG: HAD-IC family P-type ATPase, partial [Pseudomonadota bacterium]
ETKTVSAFEKQISGFSTFILKLVVITLAFVFALNLGLKGLDRIEELILFSIALTVGVIPEALPIVSTIAMSRGAMRMAKRNVIVKRLSAIDDLGSIDILCTDKTGTITQNILHVADVHADDADACLRYALLGSSFLGEREKQPNNAFDVAVWKHVSSRTRRECSSAKKLAELPFDPVRRRNAVLVEEGGGNLLIVRGSPDDVLPLCADVPDQLALGKYLAAQGLSGNRVIAIAVRRDVPAELDLERASSSLTFAGIISFHDPLKRDAAMAARRAAALGVQIKILTGDSKEVAGAVALKLHLVSDALEVITGAEFGALEPDAQLRAVRDYHVFARVNPRQKFAILALMQQNNVVGFLGEGFNDAPGLKMANVGLAVEGASDIAKEAADVILLNRNLSVIFDGIEEGRRTFANTIKYLKVTLASNFGNFYAVAVASFFIDFLPMKPVQILLLNLLTDVPMITIAADTVDTSELKKPRHYDARHLVLYTTVLGFVSSIFDFTTFALFQKYGEGMLQSLWFTVSALTEIVLIYSLRTSKFFLKGSRPAPSIIALSIGAAALAIIIPLSPFGTKVFGFARPSGQHMLMVFGIVALYLVATETVKRLLIKTSINGNGKHA